MKIELVKINGVDTTVCITVSNGSTFSFSIVSGSVQDNSAQRNGSAFRGTLKVYEAALHEASLAYELNVFDDVIDKS